MSELSIAVPRGNPRPKFSIHRVLVMLAIVAAVLLVVTIALYGFDYYWLSLSERPFSPKHFLLKPSGRVGIGLGLFGLGLFLVIFLYPLRKRIKWLAVRGSARHWLDFHVIAGSLAPVIIMFHASFKFQGVAGLAFWFMLAVALSGIVGRYLYAQIPPTLKSAERSLAEIEEMHATVCDEGSSSPMSDSLDLRKLLTIPSSEQIKGMSAFSALGSMIWLDVTLPVSVARFRARAAGRTTVAGIFMGIAPSGQKELEAAIQNARRQAALAKRVAFLTKTHQMFHLWHVVHRPFSYSFAVLALIHLAAVIALGYL